MWKIGICSFLNVTYFLNKCLKFSCLKFSRTLNLVYFELFLASKYFAFENWNQSPLIIISQRFIEFNFNKLIKDRIKSFNQKQFYTLFKKPLNSLSIEIPSCTKFKSLTKRNNEIIQNQHWIFFSIYKKQPNQKDEKLNIKFSLKHKRNFVIFHSIQ